MSVGPFLVNFFIQKLSSLIKFFGILRSSRSYIQIFLVAVDGREDGFGLSWNFHLKKERKIRANLGFCHQPMINLPLESAKLDQQLQKPTIDYLILFVLDLTN